MFVSEEYNFNTMDFEASVAVVVHVRSDVPPRVKLPIVANDKVFAAFVCTATAEAAMISDKNVRIVENCMRIGLRLFSSVGRIDCYEGYWVLLIVIRSFVVIER